MTRRFMRSIAVVGTIGLTSLGADAAAAAVTTPVVHSAPAVAAVENEDVDDARPPDSPEPDLVDLATAADAIGVTLPALHEALHTDGATLGGVAEAHGVASGSLEAALVAEAARRLDAAAMAGHLSAWEVWERRAVLPDVVAAAVQADRSVEVA